MKDISEQCIKLVEELEIQFSKVEQFFKQFKSEILSKYSILESKLLNLNQNQISNTLSNFVKFNEEKKELANDFIRITDNFIESLRESSKKFEISQVDDFQTFEDEVHDNSKPFSYVLMQENRKHSSIRCCSFAFNNDSSIIVAGLESGAIQIFELVNELMKEKQICKNHKDAVYCLQFMTKSNQFVSGSEDASLIIWSINDQQEWFNSTKLIGHTGIMMCLILDNSENVIFSGNSDRSIKIWDKQCNYNCTQTLNEISGDILSLSLNSGQDMLISCIEKSDQIIVYQRSDNLWKFYQKISVQLWGYRLCFVGNNRFAFQPNASNIMEIYELNQITKQFTQINKVPVESDSKCDALFPQQFVKQKSILVNKNGCFVNLFRIMPNKTIQSQESIKFCSEQIYGALDKKGEYLITWDEYSQQVQLRKYKEQQIII
ncbi:unnamed protein product (macronuclear) [Paramecium tetraurelia]|uniref:Uncharacterized protein n=1 Tax=Paramecium tetraurelia TaxID=5888 RepID=A0D132_PARTE|nr:uncharacterized protein GSPATT00039164001 [Paramecium tetraurelia]CAK76749.1 unnamed protein product [Paramecium tetraurelia]|eukprot:XP_001444146.1 hypothetical protein (macronuclear) [Paramecium tetraurelia strain d4-2]